MLKSLRSQILIVIVGVLLLCIGVIGIETAQSLENILKRDAYRLVSLTAETRQAMLIRALKVSQERAESFLSRIHLICHSKHKLFKRCVKNSLVDFLEAEGASSALLRYKNLPSLVAGAGSSPILKILPKAGQLAAFEFDMKRQPYYVIQAKTQNNKMVTLYYNFQNIEEIFSDPPEIGPQGETFLIDPQGLFITTPRFNEPKNSDSNVATQSCLEGKSGLLIAHDYRDTPAVQAFRYVPEIGGGCIKAIVPESQMLTPLYIMRYKIFKFSFAFMAFAILCSWILSNRLLSPIGALAKRVVAFESGDLESPIPMKGPSEIQQFAGAFASMAAALRKMIRDREELLAIVSHDLKNPIASIQLNAGLIERTLASQRVVTEPNLKILDRVRSIFESCRHMQNLITNLLDAAKIEAGCISLDKKEQDACLIIKDASDFFQNLASEKGILFEIEPSQTRFPVFYDRERIFQVMSNLIGNALKFTAEKGCISIGFDRRENEAVFFVKNTGVGISSESIPHLFDRYWQAKHAKKKGSGLGLYISQQIILAHGGHIWVESSPGHGATFRFSIPKSSVST